MASPPREYISQRRLAVELRYRIDVAMRAEERYAAGGDPGPGNVAPVSVSLGRVRELTVDHPQGMLSRHVQHNLGPARMQWLREKGLIE